MGFISGRHTVCADPACTYTGGLDIKREHWDGIDKVIVGEEHCPACKCMMLYTRKPMPQERPAAATWAHMQVIFPLPLLGLIIGPDVTVGVGTGFARIGDASTYDYVVYFP